MAAFFKSSEPSSKDDKLTGYSGNSAGDKGNTPTNTPSGGSQTPLTKGLKAAVAKGLEDQKRHPEKSVGEIVQDVVAGSDIPEGVTKDAQGPVVVTKGSQEVEGVAGDAGELVEGSKQKDGQAGRKSSTGNTGGAKHEGCHHGRRATTDMKET